MVYFHLQIYSALAPAPSNSASEYAIDPQGRRNSDRNIA